MTVFIDFVAEGREGLGVDDITQRKIGCKPGYSFVPLGGMGCVAESDICSFSFPVA